MGFLESKMNKIKALCKKHKVSSLFAFGSVLTPEFSMHSDVDLLVSFGKMNLEEYADNYFSLKSALETLLQRPVDLMEEQAIHNPFLRESIDTTKRMLYGH